MDCKSFVNLFVYPLALGLFFFKSFSARAEIRILNISGASKREFSFGNPQINIDTVYGGVSGLTEAIESSRCLDDDRVCNTCQVSSSECNFQAIHENLKLKISFSSTVPGRILVATENDQNFQAIAHVSPLNDQPLVAGAQVEVSIRWRDICRNLSSNPNVNNCKDAGDNGGLDARFRIGVDSDNNGLGDGDLDGEDSFIVLRALVGKIGSVNVAKIYQNEDSGGSDDDGGNGLGQPEGILGCDRGNSNCFVPLCSKGGTRATGSVCNFIAYPGDQKVFIESIRAGCDFPNLVTSPFPLQYVRVFYDDKNHPSPTTQTYKDLDLDPSVSSKECKNSQLISVEDNQIGGLTNGQDYYFRLGLVDKAGNVGFFTQIPTYGSLEPNKDISSNEHCYDPSIYPQNCHMSVPSKVLGFSSKKWDCFIATATYGSILEGQVQTFRAFRDQFLKKYFFGQLFVALYYKLSPPLAYWIQSHPQVRSRLALLLWPFWKGAQFFTFLGTHLSNPISTQRDGTYNYGSGPKPKLPQPSKEIPQPEKVDEQGAYYYGPWEEGSEKQILPPGRERPKSQDSDGTYHYSQGEKSKDLSKGLFFPQDVEKVLEDGAYVYKVSQQFTTQRLSLGLGPFGPIDLKGSNGSFEEFYPSNSPWMFLIQYEWQLFHSLGDFFLKVGTGLAFTQGRGQFTQGIQGEVQPRGVLQFFLFPNTVGLSYKMQWDSQQLLTPYLDGGVGYWTFLESGLEGGSQFGGGIVIVASGGLLIRLSPSLWGSYEDRGGLLSNFWLDVQFRQTLGLNPRKNFTGQQIVAGFSIGF